MGDIRPPVGDPLLKAGCINPYNRQLAFGTSPYYRLYCPNAIGVNSFLNQTNTSPYFVSYMDNTSMNYYPIAYPDYMASFKYYADSMSLYVNSYQHRIDLSSNDAYSYISTSRKYSNISAELASDAYGGQLYIQSSNSNTHIALDTNSTNVNMELSNGNYSIQNIISNSNAYSYMTNGSNKGVSINLADLGSDSNDIKFRNCGTAGSPLWILTNKTFATGAGGNVCWGTYGGTTLQIGNNDCPVQVVQMLGTENGAEGIFLEKTNTAGSIKIGDNTSAVVQTFCQTNSNIQANLTNTSATAKFEASTAADKYALGSANSNGGYFEALAGSKQILLSANTLSANQALTLKNWDPNRVGGLYVASTEVIDLSTVTGKNCWSTYAGSTLTLGNATCPVQTVQMLGTENGAEGIFLEKTNTAGSIKIGDNTSAVVQTFCQTNSNIQANLTNTSATAKFEASTAADKYALGSANSNGGYFEALAGSKQILLSANTLSANQALTLKNWDPNRVGGLYVASTEVIDLSTVTGKNCWSTYAGSTLTLGNATCPVQTVQMLGTENGAEGIFLEKTNSASTIKLLDSTFSSLEAISNLNNVVKAGIYNNTTSAFIKTQGTTTNLFSQMYTDSSSALVYAQGAAAVLSRLGATSTTSDLQVYNSFGGAYGAANVANAYLRVQNAADTRSNEMVVNATTAYSKVIGGTSTIFSQMYTDSSSALVYAQGAAAVLSRLGATSTTSDLQVYNAFGGIYAATEASNAYLTVQNASATKYVSLSLGDISTASYDIRFRNWGTTLAPIWALSNSATLPFAPWAIYNDTTDFLTIGNTNYPVLTMWQSYDGTSNNGTYLTTQQDRSEVYVLKNDTYGCTIRAEPALAFIKTQGATDTRFSQMYTDSSSALVYAQGAAAVLSRLGATSTTSDLQVYNSFGGAYGAANVANAYLRVQNAADTRSNEMVVNATTAYSKVIGGTSTIFSQMYTDSSSALVYAQGAAAVLSRLGATSTTSDLQVYNAFGGIYAATEASNAYLRVQKVDNSKAISLSITDFGTTAATTVRLREFSICVNGETKKCLILASEYYT